MHLLMQQPRIKKEKHHLNQKITHRSKLVSCTLPSRNRKRICLLRFPATLLWPSHSHSLTCCHSSRSQSLRPISSRLTPRRRSSLFVTPASPQYHCSLAWIKHTCNKSPDLFVPAHSPSFDLSLDLSRLKITREVPPARADGTTASIRSDRCPH